MADCKMDCRFKSRSYLFKFLKHNSTYVGRTEYKTIRLSMSNIYLMLFQFNDGRLLTWTMDGIIIYGKSLKLRMLQ